MADCCEDVPKQKKFDPAGTPPHPNYKVPFVLCRSNTATSVNIEDMHSLQKELRELNVCPPTRRKNESNTPETSDRNTAATTSPSHLDHFIRDLDERKGKLSCCQEVTEIQTMYGNLLTMTRKLILRGMKKLSLCLVIQNQPNLFHHTPSKLLFCLNGVKTQKTSSGLGATSPNVL